MKNLRLIWILSILLCIPTSVCAQNPEAKKPTGTVVGKILLEGVAQASIVVCARVSGEFTFEKPNAYARTDAFGSSIHRS